MSDQSGARLPYLNVEDLAEGDRDLLSRNINLARTLVHSPNASRHISRLGMWIRHDCTLDPRLRELAILQVGYLVKCAYEYSHHIKISREFGVTDDDIRALIRETNGEPTALPELDQAVLRAAREMTEHLRVKDDTFSILKSRLSNEHIVDLIAVIGFYNCIVRLLESLDIEVEPEYQQYLDEFPLARV
jgi:alkylhydroperoxidase family enzyme